jgi:hypothetical protein
MALEPIDIATDSQRSSKRVDAAVDVWGLGREAGAG